MPNSKISQLTDGGAAQAADEFVVARGSDNRRIDGASVAAAATSVGTLTSLTTSGKATVAGSLNDDVIALIQNTSATGFGMRLDGGGTGKYVASIRNQAGTEIIRVLPASRVGIGTTAADYALEVVGTVGFAPGASVTPAKNGDVVIEATNNTTLTFKLKGSDGVVRSATLTLA